MKVIDLLNKIANGEEVPKKIKWGCHYLEWIVYDYKVVNELGSPAFFELTKGITKSLLNDEVEILEEPKGIPEKLDHLIGYDIQQFDDLKEYVEITTNDLFGKANKIIDTLNQLLDYLESKGESND